LTTNAIALVVAGDAALHFGDVVIEPTLGAGVVPYANGLTDVAGSNTGGPYQSHTSRTVPGLAWSAGIGIRFRRVVVEQHLLWISGADAAIRNGEYAPLTIGVRF
jgi:hypothetical protein